MKSLMPILLIGVSIGLFYIHIDPMYTEVKAVMKQKSEYSDALEKAVELQGVRDELLTKYNALPKDDLLRLERLIPTDLNTVKLVTDIASIAGPYGIVPERISVKEAISDTGQEITEAVQKPYQTTNISFTFSSTYPNLVLFLKDLEKSLQLVDVRSITFSVPEEDTDIYEYSVSIDVYWLK
jgi:Tfp pilus assembly protein PilO